MQTFSKFHLFVFAGTVGIVDYTNYDDMKYAVSFYAQVNGFFWDIEYLRVSPDIFTHTNLFFKFDLPLKT